LQAGSAASGFSATDPTTLNLAGDISEYGTYKQQVAVAGGQAKKEARYATAATKRTTGDAVVKAAKYSALGTILGGVSSLAKYG
jgi:hypothetical protein